jgi:hypothetical protein
VEKLRRSGKPVYCFLPCFSISGEEAKNKTNLENEKAFNSLGATSQKRDAVDLFSIQELITRTSDAFSNPESISSIRSDALIAERACKAPGFEDRRD